ncbi:MAG: methyltransferase domain-containing protein [Steroidobacteraceae bacterium]
MAFKDHFSRQAAGYRRYRPASPAALIEFVAAQAPDRSLAVDCATGSGQAAVALADHFDRVVALDGSVSQLGNAEAHGGVRYVAGVAERMPVASGCVALVAAAQALHWFDFARFHAECRRVLMAGGVVAAWSYEKFRVAPDVDAVVDRFYDRVIGEYWPPERRYVEAGYRTLPFPWREIPAPPFLLECDWDLDQLMGYLATWSAVQRCRDRTGADPLPALRVELERLWPGGPRRLSWPIHLRLGCA